MSPISHGVCAPTKDTVHRAKTVHRIHDRREDMALALSSLALCTYVANPSFIMRGCNIRRLRHSIYSHICNLLPSPAVMDLWATHIQCTISNKPPKQPTVSYTDLWIYYYVHGPTPLPSKLNSVNNAYTLKATNIVNTELYTNDYVNDTKIKFSDQAKWESPIQ